MTPSISKLTQAAIDGDRAASVSISLMETSGEEQRLEKAEAMRLIVLHTNTREIRVPMCESLNAFIEACGFQKTHPQRFAAFVEALEVAENKTKLEKAATSERNNFTSLLAVSVGVGCWLLTRMMTDDDGLRFLGILASLFLAAKVYWSGYGKG